jgi:hypothetical protein
MKDADLKLKAEGKVVATVKLDAITLEEKEITINATDQGSVTKFTTRIVVDETTTSVKGPEETEEHEDIGALSGQIVTSEKTKSGWKHTLNNQVATKAHNDALADMSPWDDEESIPSGMQKIGATWEIDAVHFKKFLGESWSAVSGKVKATFTGVKKVNGELCAVVESTGIMKGKLKAEGNEKVATMELTFVEYRSFKHGVVIKAEGQVTLKASGKEKIEGNDLDVSIQGKAKLEFVTEIRD